MTGAELRATIVRMIWTLLIVFAVFILMWGWFSSGLIIYGNRDPLTATPSTFGLRYTDEDFKSEDGVPLKAWFIAAEKPTDVTLVICHGWGANRSDILERTHFLAKDGGYNLFFFDFRNHGASGAAQSSLTTLETGDLRAALAHLRAAHPEQAKRIGIFGMSMGGTVSLCVAAHDKGIAAVAAESSFTSYNEVVARFGEMFYHVPKFPFAPMTRFATRLRLGFDPDKTTPLAVIAQISPRPLFLLQGDADPRMPTFEGERLFAAAKEPKILWTVPGADHGRIAEVAGPEFRRRTLEFFDGVFKKK